VNKCEDIVNLQGAEPRRHIVSPCTQLVFAVLSVWYMYTVDVTRCCKLLSFCLLYLLFCYCQYACDLHLLFCKCHAKTSQPPPTQRRHGPSFISIPNLKRIVLFVQKLWGVPKLRNWVTWPRPRLLMDRFMVPTQYGSVFHLCTKFEVDCSVCSKVKGSQNLEIRPRDPGHAHLGLFYGPYSGRLSPSCLYQIWSV